MVRRWLLSDGLKNYVLILRIEATEADVSNSLDPYLAVHIIDYLLGMSSWGGQRRIQLVEACEALNYQSAVHTADTDSTRLLSSVKSALERGLLLLAPEQKGGSAVSSRGPLCAADPAASLLKPALPKPPLASAQKLINPLIRLPAGEQGAVVLVKKPYLTAVRRPVQLQTDSAFSGQGTLSCSGGHILLFTQATGGTQITFNGEDNCFTGSQLTAGHTVYVEGVSPSDSLGDCQLTLTLSGGSDSLGPPARASLTAVEVTLDLCASRRRKGEPPAVLSVKDKITKGRPLHLQAPGSVRHRAMVIVRKAKPAAFTGNLVLTGCARLALFDAEVPHAGESALAGPQLFANQSIPAAGRILFAQGQGLSTALCDAELSLGIKDVGPLGDRVVATVCEIKRLEVLLDGTPCRRTGSVSPQKHIVTTDQDTFAADSPVVIRGCGELRLKAEVVPAVAPLAWAVRRASDDHGLSGLPSHKEEGSTSQRLLQTDATGSFHMQVFADSRGDGSHGPEEDGLTLNLTMVKVEVLPGAANNRIITRNSLFTDTRSNDVDLCIDSGSTGGIAPGVNDVYTDAEFTKHPLAMKVTVKLTGGGSDQRRGVDRIGLGYIQTTPSDSICGSYTHGKTAKEVILQAPTGAAYVLPGSTPALLSFPVRDTRGAGASGTAPFIVSSSDAERASLPDGGQKRVVRFVDPPAILLPYEHPAPAVPLDVLTGISGSNDFVVFLCGYSQGFDMNYTAIARATWSATYGTYTAAAGWRRTGAAVVASGSAMTVYEPPKPGRQTDLERCPPNFVDNLVLDAR